MIEGDPIVEDALNRARRRRQLHCSPEQLLEAALLGTGENVRAYPVTEYLDARPRLAFEPSVVELSRSCRKFLECLANRQQLISGEIAQDLLQSSSPVLEKLREAVGASFKSKPTAETPRGSLAQQLPTPESVSPLVPIDTDHRLVDRRDLVDRALLALMFGSLVIVGPVGSGRRSLLRLLVRRQSEGALPDHLEHLKMFGFDSSSIVAGKQHGGSVEDFLKRIVDQLLSLQVRPVLVMEDLMALLSAGSSLNGVDPVRILLPHLRESRIALVGIVSQDDYREALETRPELSALLSPLYMPSMKAQEAEDLLERMPEHVAADYGISCSPSIVSGAVLLCERHLPHSPLLGAVGKLVRGAAARLAFEAQMLERDGARAGLPYWKRMGPLEPTKKNGTILGERHLLLALSDQYRIPFDHLEAGAAERVRKFEKSFTETIFGQKVALEMLVSTVKVAITCLSHPRHPRGRLFFVGPPGTGKTESAQLLAKSLMGDPDSLLRFNMSEYSGEGSVASLIGSDRGLVGSDRGGRLTEPLRENPHRVVLLDEIEKASPKVFDLFLQILEDGQIEDKQGRVASFRHAICVFTSNAGCENGSFSNMRRGDIERRLRTVFRPEFIDRIDALVPFNELTEKARTRICEAQLELLRHQIHEVHGMALGWDGSVVKLGIHNEERQPGARHILRWLQGVVKPIVVNAVLNGSQGQGIRLVVGRDGSLVANENAMVELVPPGTAKRTKGVPGIPAQSCGQGSERLRTATCKQGENNEW